MSQAMALSFNDVQFDVVDQVGQPWLQARQIGEALGYSKPETVFRIYERNKDEFTDKMTCIVNLTMQGQKRSIRIFSLRGAHLIAMFARTKVAKEFRQWVLDVLDHYVNGSAEPKIPTPLTPSTKDDRKPLRDLVAVWCRLSGRQYSEAWKQVRAAFSLNNIKELPREWVPDACSWVQSKIDALPQGLPEASGNPMFYDQIMHNIYHTGLELCGQIRDEAEKALDDFERGAAKRSTDLAMFRGVHQQQIRVGTDFLMTGVQMIMRSVEAVKYAERLNR
ncbi:MAG: Bro-N domain-containing protein [Desulfovermiculus sp.]